MEVTTGLAIIIINCYSHNALSRTIPELINIIHLIKTSRINGCSLDAGCQLD